MAKNEYMVIVPDKANALQARMEVRAQHFTNLKKEVEAGNITMGGASLTKEPKEGEGLDMDGSIMLVHMDSKDAVRKWLDSDIYAQKGVWDTSKAQIIPFKCGARTAM